MKRRKFIPDTLVYDKQLGTMYVVQGFAKYFTDEMKHIKEVWGIGLKTHVKVYQVPWYVDRFSSPLSAGSLLSKS